MTDVTKLPYGTFVIAEDGTWIEGCYTTEEAARLAATVDPDILHALWTDVLEAGREALTIDDIKGGVQC